ncbi:MAG: HNH endonuclease [Candidatus Acidiferrum sp.]
MNFFVAVTDYDWFQLHTSKSRVEEVNFWRPSSEATFKALKTGELFLFKLHSPRNFIVGGGFFTRFVLLPLSLAWEAFGEGNGVRSLSEMRTRIAKLRRTPIEPSENPSIGCILLAEPFFFNEAQWIPIPSDFSLNIVQGKTYDNGDRASGQALWAAVTDRLRIGRGTDVGPATTAAVEGARYGEPVLVQPRLGQGTFRVIVTEAYERRCAITGERTLPVLDAAHIKPYGLGGPHDPENGLLLRSDLHTLFDQRYMTIDAGELKVIVSPRIREEFENGRDYYQLHGRAIRLPRETSSLPSREYLTFHNNLFH